MSSLACVDDSLHLTLVKEDKMFGARSIVATGLGLLLVVGGAAAAVRTPGPEYAASFLTDNDGRALVQHGFSMASSSKIAPDGMPIFTDDELAKEQTDMGTNFVRFLISWRMVEPSPGVYDQDYLDDVEERVGWYADRGYHVMLDMHQDTWGQGITTERDNGNGAPVWATYLDGFPVEHNDMWEL